MVLVYSQKENAKKFVLEMAELQKKLKADFAPYAGLKVVTFHKAWDYFADEFAMNIVTIIEPKPAITPSPTPSTATGARRRRSNPTRRSP